MKFFALLILLSFSLLSVCINPALAKDDPKARAVMEKVEDRDDGDNQENDMTMILIDKKGRERVRKIHSFTKDFGEDTHRIMFFLHPPDVKDTGFLTYDYDDPAKDDDQWLYLPALRKTKRIASSDKSSSFMGSDFSYADMTRRVLDEWDYKLLKEDLVDGQKVWLIETLPVSKAVEDRYGYKKSIVYVRQDNFMVIRAIHVLKSGNKVKYMEVKKIDQIDGIWVAVETWMKTTRNKRTLHRTILTMDDIKYNQDLDESIFSVRQLEKGL